MKRFFACAVLLLSGTAFLAAEELTVVKADRELLEQVYAEGDLYFRQSPNIADYARFRLRTLWEDLVSLMHLPATFFDIATKIRYFVYGLIILLMAWILYIFLKPKFAALPLPEEADRHMDAPGRPSSHDLYRSAVGRGAFKEALHHYIHHGILRLADRYEAVRSTMTLRECALVSDSPAPSEKTIALVEASAYGPGPLNEETLHDRIARLKVWIP